MAYACMCVCVCAPVCVCTSDARSIIGFSSKIARNWYIMFGLASVACFRSSKYIVLQSNTRSDAPVKAKSCKLFLWKCVARRYCHISQWDTCIDCDKSGTKINTLCVGWMCMVKWCTYGKSGRRWRRVTGGGGGRDCWSQAKLHTIYLNIQPPFDIWL